MGVGELFGRLLGRSEETSKKSNQSSGRYEKVSSTEGDGVTESKRAKRHELVRRLQVHDGETNKVLGEVANLSRSGFRLKGRREFSPGTELPIRIAWSKNDTWQSVNVRARVAWCKQAERSLDSETGMEFVDSDRPSRVKLEKLISELGYSF